MCMSWRVCTWCITINFMHMRALQCMRWLHIFNEHALAHDGLMLDIRDFDYVASSALLKPACRSKMVCSNMCWPASSWFSRPHCFQAGKKRCRTGSGFTGHLCDLSSQSLIAPQNPRTAHMLACLELSCSEVCCTSWLSYCKHTHAYAKRASIMQAEEPALMVVLGVHMQTTRRAHAYDLVFTNLAKFCYKRLQKLSWILKLESITSMWWKLAYFLSPIFITKTLAFEFGGSSTRWSAICSPPSTLHTAPLQSCIFNKPNWDFLVWFCQ